MDDVQSKWHKDNKENSNNNYSKFITILSTITYVNNSKSIGYMPL